MALIPLTRASPRWAVFESALRTSALPIEDLDDAGQRFYALGAAPAFGGLALVDRVALLRSIVVDPSLHGTGTGRVLLYALIDEARRAGATQAWLLTTTAAAFFARNGFMPASGGNAAPEIADSRQFSSLCPSTAVLMCRRLG